MVGKMSLDYIYVGMGVARALAEQFRLPEEGAELVRADGYWQLRMHGKEAPIRVVPDRRSWMSTREGVAPSTVALETYLNMLDALGSAYHMEPAVYTHEGTVCHGWRLVEDGQPRNIFL